jgi:beta-galactosidase
MMRCWPASVDADVGCRVVPAPLLRGGDNEVVVLELHGTETGVLEFKDVPDPVSTEKP